MTDEAMLTEMARLLAIIERYWADEIDALTIHPVRAILAEHRLRLHSRGAGLDNQRH
jgi:hypothetical protein